MPTNRNALLRFVRIDQALKDKNHYYTFEELHEFVKNGLDFHVSSRQLYEDLRFLQYERPFYAKIEKVMRSGHKIYRYADPDYSIFSSYILPPDALSNRAKEVIERYVSKNSEKHGTEFPYVGLMLALYAYSGRAKGDHEPIDDFVLTASLSDDEIAVLLKEYTAVINHCNSYCTNDMDDLWDALVNVQPGEHAAIVCGKYLDCDWHTAALLDVRGATVDKYDELPATDAHTPKYDYVFVGIPATQRPPSPQFEALPRLAANLLKEGGRLFAVLPYRFLNGSDAADVREALTREDKYSLLVVTEPAYTSYRNMRDTALLSLTRDGGGTVTLVDCNDTGFTTAQDAGDYCDYHIIPERIVDTIRHADTLHVWQGSARELLPGASLLPSRYLLRPSEPTTRRGIPIVELRDIIAPVRTYRRCRHPEHCPHISHKLLSNDSLDCDIDVSQITEQHDTAETRLDTRIITRDCLLALYDTQNVFVARTHGISRDNPVVISPLAIPFVVTSDRITEEYLLGVLSDTKSVKRQLNRLSVSPISAPIIRPIDFLSLRIPLPSLAQQQKCVDRDRRKKQAICEARQKDNAPTDPPTGEITAESG